jgi:predicted GTPase
MSLENTTEDKVLQRNEGIITILLKLIDNIPDFVPGKGNIQEPLHNLRSALLGLRPPRIMIIGRCKSGKSSLINAICGLRVAEVSTGKPETGKAEWKEYEYQDSEFLHLLDTRGLQESTTPRQPDTAKTPYESIMQAVREKCPDVILFLCKATDVHVAVQEDLDICVKILLGIKKIHNRNLPILGVLTQCDQLDPLEPLPTEDEETNRQIQQQQQDFYAYLKERKELRQAVKDVIPTVALAKYEPGRNGLIIPDRDRRWNITKLVDTMIQHTPGEMRGSFARMAHLSRCQLGVANTMVTTCSVLSGAISTAPIPGAAIPVVSAIQTFMIMYIAWIGGREFSEQAIQDFTVFIGAGAGVNVGIILSADLVLKFIPGIGTVISVGASVAATKGLGDLAIKYFLNNGKNYAAQAT